ncbi:SGNH/GDSL hydrolase family protein [Streptomyces griseoloalbus]|uniref:Lysophospholipase L1-like esterase n=1 Tax=Streptomyces griseoloalbus TaxID=67303 RepID=A0A7W8BH91_9ACTN|nr:SGNH/GDSL hydrolase family protein [Streptomyces albaduncus]MBB5123399.1 lysophospholipase L1-like esterase [Streptomyces albaduncus]GGW52473.1 SGNH hydrolase [Streptomyces albaduncus]
MTRGRDGGAGAPPARQRALLTAIVAAIVAVSAAIYVGVAADDGTTHHNTLAGGRGERNNPAAPASTGTWVASWATSPVGGEPGTEMTGLAGRSVRNVVHTSAGGTSARVTLSNLYGQSPLTITHASIAVSAGSGTAAALAETMRHLTFTGSPTVVIPAGGQVISDIVRIAVPHDGDVLVTTYSPTPSGPVTYHPHARQISYVAEGEHTRDATGAAYTEQSTFWRYVTALDVLSNESDGTVVVLGDSLTDGITSTTGANNRWPDVLSDRLRDALASGRDVPRYSVVNEGISGNRVLTDGLGRPAENPSGVNRFGRDVLGRTNVKVVVVVLGINDILRHPGTADPDRIVAGLDTLVERAHAQGLKAVGATLMPFGGHRGHTDAREAVRQRINEEIRAGHVFDAVADFDKALRDPYDPRRFRSDYDSGDHLHPSDKGYKRMAETFDLDTLKGGAPAEL